MPNGSATKPLVSRRTRIVYHKQSILTHVSGAIHSPVYVFKCYGGSDSDGDARNIGRLLYDRLFGADGATASGQMITAEVAGGGGIVKEPGTKFWADISIYQILIAG